MPGTAPEITPPVAAVASVDTTAPTPKPPPENPPSTAAAPEPGVPLALSGRRPSAGASRSDRDLAHSALQDGASSGGATAKENKEHQLKQFADDGRHFSMVRNFRLADLVTLMNGFCGSMSLFSSASYLVTADPWYLWSALAYPLGGLLFDFFDGKVARWRNESSMLGQELDSLADSLSFGVAPAVCGYIIGLREPLDQVALTVFICCGIARLARFNATVALVPKDDTGKSKYFEGLPIPSSLIVVGVMAEFVRRGWIEQGVTGPGFWWLQPFWLPKAVTIGTGLPGGYVPIIDQFGLKLHTFSLVFVVWAAMMVSKTLRVPKP